MHVPNVLVQISISSFHLNDLEWITLLTTMVFLTFDIITFSDYYHFCPCHFHVDCGQALLINLV